MTCADRTDKIFDVETVSRIECPSTPHRLRPHERATHTITLGNYAASEVEVDVICVCRSGGALAYVAAGRVWAKSARLKVRKRIRLPRTRLAETIENTGSGQAILEDVSISISRTLGGVPWKQMFGDIKLKVNVQ